MLLLIISILALVLGPLLHNVATRASASYHVLDGFVVMAIVGLIATHVVPESIAVAGPYAALFTLVGFLGPGFVEKMAKRMAARTHRITVVFVCIGLVVHALFDGVALGIPAHSVYGSDSLLSTNNDTLFLGLAIILHRLPLGITLWTLSTTNAKYRLGIILLAALSIATVIGYFVSQSLFSSVEESWIGYLQAIVGGSLLHVVVHRPVVTTHHDKQSYARWQQGLGAIVAIALLWITSGYAPAHTGGHDHELFDRFLHLASETAPALLIAFLLSGFIQVFAPESSTKWLRTGKASSESLRGVLFGLPLPICSCGVVPLYRTIVQRGVPATAAMAFLVATPELGLDAILISLPLLGGEFTIYRIVVAFVAALATGWIVGSMIQRPETIVQSPPTPPPQSLASRLRRGISFGFGDTVDHVGPWIFLGLLIAAIAAPILESSWVTTMPPYVDVFLFAIIGMPVYVCASGATPLAAILIAAGVSPGAGLAFLISGPATNLTTFGVLQALHSKKVATAFAACIVFVAVASGIAVNVFFSPTFPVWLAQNSHHSMSGMDGGFVIALAIVFLLSVARQGPRSFLLQIIAPYEEENDDTCCHEH